MGKIELPAAAVGGPVFVVPEDELEAADAEFEACYEAEEGGDDGED